jgi:steroid Delta-isomerase
VNTSPPQDHAAALRRLVDFFQTLTPARVADLKQHYAQDVWFKDPFNEVNSLAEVEAIFRHMFVQLEQPRFVVHECIDQGDQAFLTWDFLFHMRRWDTARLHTIRGASHVRFNPQGLVAMHRDYWDAAEELYEKLPGLGAFMRWLKARARS